MTMHLNTDFALTVLEFIFVGSIVEIAVLGLCIYVATKLKDGD